MPSVLILRGTLANGAHQDPGSVVELSDEDARVLVALGKASHYAEPAVTPEVAATPAPAKRKK